MIDYIDFVDSKVLTVDNNANIVYRYEGNIEILVKEDDTFVLDSNDHIYAANHLHELEHIAYDHAIKANLFSNQYFANLRKLYGHNNATYYQTIRDLALGVAATALAARLNILYKQEQKNADTKSN